MQRFNPCACLEQIITQCYADVFLFAMHNDAQFTEIE